MKIKKPYATSNVLIMDKYGEDEMNRIVRELIFSGHGRPIYVIVNFVKNDRLGFKKDTLVW